MVPLIRARPRRCAYHTRTHTLLSPTPSSLQSFLSANPIPTTSVSLYLLSTSLSNYSTLLSSLQSHLNSSIGSFSTCPAHLPPTLSIATFSHGAQIFRSELSGRPSAEVGRRQRPPAIGWYAEDRKGSVEGDVSAVREGEGWAGLWRSQLGGERIAELQGVR